MRDHNPGVGIGGKEEGQGGQVRGCFEDPAGGRLAGDPLQRLEMALVPVVDGRLVRRAAPDGVVGHVVEAGVHVARELVGEDEDALVGEPPAVLVHLGEGRDKLLHQHDLVVAQVARRVVVGGGVQHLPEQRRSVVGVARQELVEERGARPTQPGHDDGAAHLLAQRGGLALPQVDHAQPVLQDQLQLAACAHAARQVQSGLVVQRGAQELERPLPPRVTEVVEAGVGAGRRP